VFPCVFLWMFGLTTPILRRGAWLASTYVGIADDEACRYACVSRGPTVSGQ
jgi:hypothetical protein